MTAATAVRWRPKEAVLPALRYLRQPVQLVRAYDRAHLRPDLIAGLTVGVVLLPQAIAFSLLAQLPPQMGLYTAVIGGIVAALWGSSEHLHTDVYKRQLPRQGHGRRPPDRRCEEGHYLRPRRQGH